MKEYLFVCTNMERESFDVSMYADDNLQALELLLAELKARNEVTICTIEIAGIR